MEFEYIHRGHERHLVMIPGWGFCAGIFSPLNLPYNYIMPNGPVYRDISVDLHDFLLKENITEVSILGWSLGALVAMDFHAEYPKMIEALFVISLRRTFYHEEIADQLDALEKEHVRTLKQFYRRCFLGQKADYTWFCRTLEAFCIRQWNKTDLEKGLMYLKDKTVNFSEWKGTNLRIFHGDRDMIVPLDQVPGPPQGVGIEVISQTGHLPFLSPGFEKILCKEE